MSDDCVKVFDKNPPDDDCTLAVSYHHWSAVGEKLSVASLVRSALESDERSFVAIDPVVEETKMPRATSSIRAPTARHVHACASRERARSRP